jgi:hypothetical protein
VGVSYRPVSGGQPELQLDGFGAELVE